MKFLSTVSGLLSLITVAVAAPTPAPQVPTGPNIIRPSVRSQYYVSTGAISYNTGVGLVSKNGRTGDITTLITINIPAAAVGKPVKFNFALDTAAATTVTGSGLLDLFSSLQPATASTSSWGPGNQRNVQLGRLSVSKGAAATWVAGFPTASQSYVFNAAGAYGFELVGVYDQDVVSWSGSNNGLWISY
jgi:hypothetical protein